MSAWPSDLTAVPLPAQGALFTPGMRPADLKRFFRLMRVRPMLQGEALAALAVRHA